ncbi:MAG: DHHA1 domain-containing protein [Gammaproteobacteria bacterium]|jgi:uncharacterized protein
MKPLLIYHGGCQDGFGAAWSVWKRHGDGYDYHPGIHHEPPPDVSGRDLVLADFSYPLDIMRQLIAEAASITIIDHHVSAARELQPLLDAGEIEGIFDMEKSGAMLTWEWFHPGETAPQLLEYIQDRDLYRFALPDSRAISSALFSWPQDFATWDRLMAGDLEQLRQDGIAIERKQQRDIQALVRSGTRRMQLAGHEVPALNVPYTMASDAGNLLAQDEPFAVCYWDDADGRVFSLRSVAQGVDVSEIARAFGGGGHRHAAGFRLAFEEAAALFNHSRRDDSPR